jgi:hypothetical protein
MDRASDYTVVLTHDGVYRLDRVTDPYPGPVANITPVRDRAQAVTGWRLRPLVTLQGSTSRVWPSPNDAIAATKLLTPRKARAAVAAANAGARP